ncbi:MAG: FliI/YscN family ATPase [Phycisphaerales bacterium JB040]
MSLLAPELSLVAHAEPVRVVGRVSSLRGMTVLAEDLPLPVGSLVRIGAASAAQPLLAEVVGFVGDRCSLMPLGQTAGVRPGQPVEGLQTHQTAPVSRRLLGRVIDGLGRPIDAGGVVTEVEPRALDPDPVSPLDRARITSQLHTGIRAMDLMTPVGKGQRLGIFSGPGVGKSTLLGQIARSTDADVNVIALIGERGREVREFVEESLGPEGLRRSVVVVATGDDSPSLRVRAAKLACTVGEYFRELGRDVLLMMDSVTRFAHAQRQIGLSVGEPPASKGYTPSVFAELARLLERAGNLGESARGRAGSVTGLYTILVEGDELNEPVSDAARGILDGHVVLSRKLAQHGHYPAIDVLDSISRVASDIAEPGHLAARTQAVRLLAAYREVEELVQIGAYARGSDPVADTAIEQRGAINELLQQSAGERSDFAEARSRLITIATNAGESIRARTRHEPAGESR